MGLYRPASTTFQPTSYVGFVFVCYVVADVFNMVFILFCVCVSIYVYIPNVSLVPLVQRTLFLCLKHDKFEIGVINVSQPPTALLFASRARHLSGQQLH